MTNTHRPDCFDRRRSVSLVATAGLLVYLSAEPASAQGNFDEVTIETTQVSGPVYLLTGAGGNMGVSSGADGVLLIDDQFAPLAPKIEAAIAALGHGKPRFVLNTHWHGDHTGGNEVFGRDGTILAHHNVRRRLAGDSTIGGRVADDKPVAALPVLTYDDGVSLHFNGEEIQILHLPTGHTDGDSVVLFTKSKVAHLGDHLFEGRFPFVDLASGGDVEGLARNIASLLERLPADIKIIPGHGKLCGRAELELYQQMLIESIALVKDGIAQGRTVDELKERGMPERWKAWSWDFISADKWLETVYASLSR